jgi:exodeoxyribonuclease V gamma subunit
MRSIPFRVVVLLGMSDGEFPRLEKTLSFDLIQKNSQAGDRSAKEEDRYLFLEALLSARQKILFSYVGRGVQDNAELPPAPVVSELLDYVKGAFLTDTGPLELVVEHPLQPFSPRYFTGSDEQALFSFAQAEATAARALHQRRSAPPFAHESLPEADLGPEVNLDDLARFLQNPARGFLQNRLGVFLGDDPALVEDREPLELGPLERYQLGATLLDQMLSDGASVSPKDVIEATGVLPDGTPGALAYQDVCLEVSQIAEKAMRYRAGEPLEPLALRIFVEDFAITGELRHLFPEAQLYWQYARVKPKNELALWLRHLALHAALDEPAGRISVLLGRRLEESRPETAVCIFEPMPQSQARDFLAVLIRLFRIGHRYPLPLFPAASKTYVSELRRTQAKGEPDEVKALAKAREEFAPSFGASLSESADPYVARVFSGLDPFQERVAHNASTGREERTPSFEQASRLVFEPLLSFMKSELGK